MKYHRGYVKCDGKKAVEKFKNIPDSDLRTLEQAEKCESYAGILAPGVVLLDFDIKEQSDIAYIIIQRMGISCRIYQSDKGYHFLMRANDKLTKCQTRVKLACGVICDVKVGTSASYECLKVNGHVREMIQDCDDPDVAPAYLSPVESDVDFLNLGDGDGRNSTLYAYILTLSKAGLSKAEIKDTINIINKFVLKEPLPQSEIDTILRDDAFVTQKPSFTDDKGRFLHSVFAEWLVNNLHIVKVSGALHIYKDGIYVRGTKMIEQEMIKHIPNMTQAKRKETYLYIDLLLEEDHEIADARYIAFNNGIYDVVTEQLMDFTPDIVLVNKIPHDYDPDAEDATMLKVMNNLTCGDPNLFDLLCEMVGYLFWRKNEMGWTFFCLGNKANGKSTFLDTLNYLLGNENTSALDLKELGKDFKSQELFGKLANIGDDIADDYISDTSIFKKVATGNIITANPKYEQPFKFRPFAKLIFSCNTFPRLNDRTNAAARRIIPIPFNATFDKNSDDYDPFVKYKLQTEVAMSTLINLGLKGLKRMLINNDFTRCDAVETEIRAIEENNNPLITFVKNHRIEFQDVDQLYSEYVWWASNTGVQSMSKPTFVKQIGYQCGLVVISAEVDGKTIETFGRE